MKKTFQFKNNSIFFFESLGISEHKTAKWIYEDIVSLSYGKKDFIIEYYSFNTKDEFFNLLNRKVFLKSKISYPIIHIEAHGNQEGLGIAETNEIITWGELNESLTPLNIRCKNNLILALGACNGHFINIDLIHRYGEYKRSPFLICISSLSKISNQEIKFGFSSLYKKFIKEKNLNVAMDEMLKETKLNSLNTASYFAERLIKTLQKTKASARFKKIASESLKELIKLGKEPLPGQNFNRNFKAIMRLRLHTYKTELLKRWKFFLMFDIDPSNEKRFNYFEELWNQ